MSKNKTNKKKATILMVAQGVIAFGVQQLTTGDYETSGVAILIGLGLMFLYEHYQIEEIPTTVSDIEDLSEAISDEIKIQNEDQ